MAGAVNLLYRVGTILGEPERRDLMFIKFIKFITLLLALLLRNDWIASGRG